MSNDLHGLQEAQSLARLISSNVEALAEEYKASGVSLPSLSSVSKGPFDVPENANFNLLRSIRIIEGACSQLAALVSPPAQVVINKSVGHHVTACLHIVAENRVADYLVDKPEGVNVDELARKSGIDAGKLSRILRMLATSHVFSEVKPNVFANNRLSVKLRSEEPVASFICHSGDESMKAMVHLNEALLDPKIGSSNLPEDAALIKAYGVPLFELYKNNEFIGKRFNSAMTGWGEVTGQGMLSKAYPWHKEPKDTKICDVGGNTGHVMLNVLQHHPELRAIVQDTPAVLEEGRKLWETQMPDALTNNRVQLTPIDFFSEAPVEGCDIYYIRHCLHNWTDAQAVTILTNTRKAMKPGNKLLIHEMVPQSAARLGDETVHEEALSPLLPNYGAGRSRMYHLDMIMLSLLNAKERTLSDFVALTEPLGFKFSRIYESGEVSLLEFFAI